MLLALDSNVGEYYIFIFIVGYIFGVISTLLFNRRKVNVESTVSLLIIAIWLCMHTYGFFFDKSVSLLVDFTGFGAAGNFIGIKASNLIDYVARVGKAR